MTFQIQTHRSELRRLRQKKHEAWITTGFDKTVLVLLNPVVIHALPPPATIAVTKAEAWLDKEFASKLRYPTWITETFPNDLRQTQR